jgi:sigma-B regulation protein RsbU (phosphoserine phosphatase)
MERAGSDRELQLARRIQQSFLPSVFPARRRFDVHATNVASKEVSGDFYDVVPVGDDGYLLAVADVSGKGVPAALLSSMLQASLRTQAPSGIRLAAMMESVNALVCQRVATGQFATFFLAAASERDMTLRFTNAGHNYPILFQARGGRRTLETGGLVVGMMEPVAYDEGTVALEPGDRLIIYSDGVTEAARADGEMFGEERLVTLVESLPAGLAARELVERVLAGLRAFLGEAEAGDDITLMALRVLPERKVATPS